MKKHIVLSVSLIVSVSILSGFALSRESQQMIITMHTKDLPEDGLSILVPSDPSFSSRFADHMKEEPEDALDAIKSFSVFLVNRSEHTVVAYVIQWCFTKADGTNDCYRKAFLSSRALMEGEDDLPEHVEARTAKVKPNSARLLSLISPNGSGPFRIQISRDEAERMKQAVRLDTDDLLQRANSELAKYNSVTVSIDGAFFEDGTFIGDDLSGFFAQTKAQIDAKRDLLNELAIKSGDSLKSADEAYKHLEDLANRQPVSLSYKSTAEDHYSYHRQFYAQQILSSRQVLGAERALAMALQSAEKTWRVLAKKTVKNR